MRRPILVALVLAAGCGGSEKPQPAERAAKTCAPTQGEAETVASAPADTPSRVRPSPGMELKPTRRNLAAGRIGDPLVVTGVIRGTDCEPLAGATVQMHQTNGRGRYGPVVNGEDRCCYLQATLRTDDAGRYTLDTVFPRGYDGGPAHIHFSFGHPDAEGIVTELVFGAPTNRAEYDITLRRR
jgi:protocatechuate 3,4-dioxygenase beta subunit